MTEVRYVYLFILSDRSGMPAFCQVVRELFPDEVPGAVRFFANQRVFTKSSVTVQVYLHNGDHFVFARNYSFDLPGVPFKYSGE